MLKDCNSLLYTIVNIMFSLNYKNNKYENKQFLNHLNVWWGIRNYITYDNSFNFGLKIQSLG